MQRQRDYFLPGPQALFGLLRQEFHERAAEFGGSDTAQTAAVRHVNCRIPSLEKTHWRSHDLSARRDGRVAEGARLESVYTGNRIVGSNPTLSASQAKNHLALESLNVSWSVLLL